MKLFVMLAAAAIAILPGGALADSYPSKPVRVIVPYPPGGGVDHLGRILSQKLSENIGQPVIIDNKPGAATQIGTEMAAKAAPDGYTLLLTSPSFTNNAALYEKLSYDAERDFEAVTLIASLPLVLVVPESSPAKSLTELIALAKAKPGSMSYGMAPGSTPHLAGEMLKSTAGIDVLAIPYKGMAAAYPDLLSGRIHYLFDALATGLPHIRAGKTRAIGVSSASRSQAAPDIPTLAESGLPGFVADAWYGIVVPKRTPPDVIAKLHAEMTRVLNDQATRGKIHAAGFDIVASGPAEYGAFMRAEAIRWSKIIKQAGIRVE